MIFYRVKATIEQKNEVPEESQERERTSLSRQRAEMICAETTVFNSVFDERYIFTVSVYKNRINMNVISKEPISELYIKQYLSTIELQSTEIQMEEVTWRDEKKAGKGWFRYNTRFALPVTTESGEIVEYNIFQAVLIVRYTSDEKLYLYDIQNIKKETSSPSEQ